MLRSLHLIIIDEASMVPIHALHAIDRLLRDITTHDVPFGGKVFLLGGDFRQVLPVVPKRPATVAIETCLKRSPTWHHITRIYLTQNMRARPEEADFAKWLLQLGDGKLQSHLPDADYDAIDIPPQCVVTGSLIDAVFPNPTEISPAHVILTPKNDESLLLNDKILNKIAGIKRTYYSSDRVVCDSREEEQNYTTEFINSITPSGMPPHRLQLKTGAIIMLLRNLDIRNRLCNGSRLIIRRLHNTVLDAELISGDKSGRRVLIPRIKLAPSDPNLPFTLERCQFPIRLAYAMTINKSQGQTYERVGIYLLSPVFAHGQLYVAFSRARAFKDILVKVEPTSSQGIIDNTAFTSNVVYQEVLH